jgi:uncharacterized protein YutE (UPF0331/DUF86 family)
LRLVYTFEAVWKTAALVLHLREGIAVGSPKATIRACRRAGLLADDDAEDALKLADERNLTVHMYREEIGKIIASHLKNHASLLRRWLDALRRAGAAEAGK